MISRASTARFAAIALAAGLLPNPVTAAPFCITSQTVPPQCIYYDALDCGHEAERQQATCAVNPLENKVRPAGGQYCVVTSSKISLCTYGDRTSCARDAVRLRGTCIDTPAGVAPPQTPDPFSPFNGN